MARKHIQAFRALPLVVACSEPLASRLRIHDLEASVIRDGIDTSKFSSALPEKRAQLRAEMQLPGALVWACV